MNEAETEVFKRIQEIARNHTLIILERDPGKQFEILRNECRRTWARENPSLSVNDQYWKSTLMSVFFDRHEAEIKEWLRDNIFPANTQQRER